MRRSSLLLLLVMLVSLCATSAAQAQQFVFSELSDPHFRRVLRGMGYDEIEILEETDDTCSMLVVINDWNVVITNYQGSGSVRMFAIFTNDDGITEETLEMANNWNRDRRFSKVLLDDDGDWIIESDFDVASGITQEQLEAWIDVWVVRLNDFADYLNE